MPSTSDLTIDNRQWAFMLYGPPGSGKTHFMRDLPKPIFFIDWDRGIITLRGESDIDYITPAQGEWAAYEKFWTEFFVQRKPAVFKGEKFDPSKYASVVIDSLTIMIDVMMTEIASKISMKDRVVLGRYTGAHRADYNVAQNVLGDGLRELLATGKNVALTAHERHEKDESTGTVLRIGPSLSPSTYNILSVLVDEIWRLDTVAVKGGGFKRILVTEPEGRYTAKARVVKGLGRLEDPTFTKIVDYVRSHEKARGTVQQSNNSTKASA